MTGADMAANELPSPAAGDPQSKTAINEKTKSGQLKQVIIACVLSTVCGPGAGQLYNRQWLKAGGFIAVVFIWIAALGLFFIRTAKLALDRMAQENPELILQSGFETGLAGSIVRENMGTIKIFKWVFIALWCYSIVDAYLNAGRRLKKDSNKGENQ
ncbi:MAG: hypothetical protein HY547_02250 [Elusimicrobia bacterium]|nr:hypothetical protein [Elusimicrobiota bacterium]